MRLTAMTDYALRLLMYVGRHPDRLCTIAEIAQVHRLSEAHMMKITHQLGLQGWIETIRGKGGGMRLARRPADINLRDVVRGIEPDFDLVECFATGNHCSLTGQCRLTGVLQDGLQLFLEHLNGYTLADLLPEAALAVIPEPSSRRSHVRTP